MGATSVSATSVDTRDCALGGGVPPATSVGSHGCRRRLLSLSHDCGDSTRNGNGDGIELDMFTEATVQVLYGPVAVPSIP